MSATDYRNLITAARANDLDRLAKLSQMDYIYTGKHLTAAVINGAICLKHK